MNNSPLMYTDPNGDLAWFVPVIAGAVGGGLNLWKNWDAVKEGGLGAGLKAFGVGAAAGVAGVYAAPAAAVGGSFWGTVGSFAAAGAVGGGVAGAIEGSGNAWLLHKASFGEVLGQGILHGVGGAASGAILGGLTGAGAYGVGRLSAAKPPSTTTSEVFDEFIDPYAVHSVSGGGSIVKQGASITDGLTFSDDFLVTANRLPFARSSITGMQVSNPTGSSISLSIPRNYVAIATRNGKGIIYRPQGVSHNNMANAIRVHLNPTSYAPNGYAVFYNSFGQPFDPNTGRTLGKALWHFLLP